MESNLKNYIEKIFLDLGIPPNVKGYKYLIAATILTEQTPAIMESFTKKLYPAVAAEYGTSAAVTERAIRYSIEKAWERCPAETSQKYFGNAISPRKGKPTNSEFIIRIHSVIKERQEVR